MSGPEQTCPTCGAPARYLAIPHPEGEGTTIPLPPGAFGGKWYHDCGPLVRAVAPAGAQTRDQKRGDPQEGDLCTAVRRYLSYITDVRSGRVKHLDRGVVLNYAQDMERHL